MKALLVVDVQVEYKAEKNSEKLEKLHKKLGEKI